MMDSTIGAGDVPSDDSDEHNSSPLPVPATPPTVAWPTPNSFRVCSQRMMRKHRNQLFISNCTAYLVTAYSFLSLGTQSLPFRIAAVCCLDCTLLHVH
jgi:hypothetical protein